MTNIDKLIEDAIDALADDNMNTGIDCMIELCAAFGKAGYKKASFNHLRQHIILEARRRDQCPVLIDTKLKLAEEQLRKIRDVRNIAH